MAKRKKLSPAKRQKLIYTGLVGVAVVGALMLLKKGVSATRMQWYGSGFKIQNKKLYYKVDIINPSNTAFTINNVFLNFYRDNYLIGKIFFNTVTSIPPNQQVSVSLPVDILPVGVALLIADLLKDAYKTFKIRVSGGVKVDGVNVPIEERIKINPSDYIS